MDVTEAAGCFNFHQSGSMSRTRRSTIVSPGRAVAGTRKAVDSRCSAPSQSDAQSTLFGRLIRGKDHLPVSHVRIDGMPAQTLCSWIPSPIPFRQYSGLYRCQRHASPVLRRRRALVPLMSPGRRCSEAQF